MTKIFISYRRSDTKLIVGRIFDRLKEEFGRDGVFMDIDGIPFGVDFREHLDREVSRASAVLVLIGHGWADASDEHGLRRLDNPDDFVRIEIETALKRCIPIGAVLIDGAPVPRSDQLPESLHPLLWRNAAQLDVVRDFDVHMARLICDLRRPRAGTKSETVAVPPKPSVTDQWLEPSEPTRHHQKRRLDTEGGASTKAKVENWLHSNTEWRIGIPFQWPMVVGIVGVVALLGAGGYALWPKRTADALTTSSMKRPEAPAAKEVVPIRQSTKVSDRLGGDEDSNRATVHPGGSESLEERINRALRDARVPERKTDQTTSDTEASAGTGLFYVQVGARSDENQALAAFRSMQQKYNAVLGKYSPSIRRSDLGDKGIWYRLRVGPFQDRTGADELCEALKVAGWKQCFSVKD